MDPRSHVLLACLLLGACSGGGGGPETEAVAVPPPPAGPAVAAPATAIALPVEEPPRPSAVELVPTPAPAPTATAPPATLVVVPAAPVAPLPTPAATVATPSPSPTTTVTAAPPTQTAAVEPAAVEPAPSATTTVVAVDAEPTASTVFYEGTATATSSDDAAAYLPFRVVRGDRIRFRATVESRAPTTGVDGVGGLYYNGAIVALDVYVNDVLVAWPAMNMALQQVHVRNDARVQEIPLLFEDSVRLGWNGTASNGTRFAFSFLLEDREARELLSSQAIPTQLEYGRASRRGISLLAESSGGRIDTFSMVADGFTVVVP